MVMGYICETHGFQHECDVSEAGERLCYECGNAVTGLTGRTRGRRAPPEDEPMHQHGYIYWTVESWRGKRTVEAFDYIDAIEKAIKEVDNPQDIREIYPKKRKYRR